MDLQYALLLVGLVIIGMVVLTVYDKGRLARSVRRGLHLTSEPSAAPNEPQRREPMMRAGSPPGSAPAAEVERKYLKGDVEPPVAAPLAPPAPPPHPLAAVLGDLEEVANRPLNLNPGFDPPGTGPEAARSLGVHMEPNEAIDFIITLPGPGPVSRRSALSVYKQNEYKLDYPRELYGRRYQTNFWSVVQHDSEATQYSDLKLAVQLVNADGPISETELNTFVQVGLKLADSLHRLTKLSAPFDKALARARDLQQFCVEHDVIAGVNLVVEPQAPLKGRAILAAAQRIGMELEPANMLVKRVDDRVLFTLTNLGKTEHFVPDWDAFRTAGLALSMYVPVAPDPAAAFDRMIEAATQLTNFLGARLLDQDQRPLSDKGIAAIRAQIKGIDAKMRAFGIAPGSEAAQRLFVVD
jgi:cell division protein ZipA